MKVLLLAENWPPRVGGIENYLTNIATHLKEAVDVVAPSARASFEKARVMRQRFFWPLIKPAWLPLFIWLYRKAKKEKYDVVLCGKALFEGLVGYYLKKRLGIPYIVFTYAMEIEVWASEHGEWEKLAKVLEAADRVVYINEVTKQSLLDLEVEESQLVKICPGVGEVFFKKVDEGRLRRVLRQHNVERPYIIAVGRLVERKGFDVLIEAFSELDQTKFGEVDLAIVGEGKEREELEKLASHLFVEESVKFLGEVKDEDLPALYQGAQLLALTPRQIEGDMEGFGIVYLEAAASGLPAVATDTGGVKEAVKAGHTGLVVPPEDPAAVRAVLERLLSDDKLRQRLGRQARARAKEEFAWAKRIRLVKEMIDKVVTRPL
ncbi:MAG: glycosyltransferase family 4 protein [bacterium]